MMLSKEEATRMVNRAPSGKAQPWRIPRKHPRVHLVTQVESLAGRETSLGTTENISMGGLRVASGKTFEPQTEVMIRFNLPSGLHIEARGVVVHAELGVYMGIQFVTVKDEDLKALHEFIREACE